MKLESLNSSKFEAFKDNELRNPLMIIGGLKGSTTWTDTGTGGSGKDTFVYGPDAPTTEVVLTDWGGGDLTYDNRGRIEEATQQMVDRWIVNLFPVEG